MHFLVSRLAHDAAQHNPYVHKVIVYDVDNWKKDSAKLAAIIRYLRQQHYELALSSNYGSLGPMMALLSGAKYRIGFATANAAKFLNIMVDYPENKLQHESEKQLDLLNPLGLTNQDSSIEFSITSAELNSLSQKINFPCGKPVVTCCPLSTDPEKNWTTSGWSSLVKQLAKYTSCCLIGSSEQLPNLNKINSLADGTAQVLAEKLTLSETAALIKISQLFITVDTGPMHISQAFQTPVLALFGPTNPLIWGPRKPQDIVLKTQAACAPCWPKTDYPKTTCTRNICMQQISYENVLATAKSMLNI